MNRIIIVPLGVLMFLAAVATGCAAEATTYEETSESDLSSEGVRMVGIGGDGAEQESIANEPDGVALPREGASAAQAGCIGCGPLPDPWKNGPLPDPWTGPTSSSGGAGSSSGGAGSSSGTGNSSAISSSGGGVSSGGGGGGAESGGHK